MRRDRAGVADRALITLAEAATRRPRRRPRCSSWWSRPPPRSAGRRPSPLARRRRPSRAAAGGRVGGPSRAARHRALAAAPGGEGPGRRGGPDPAPARLGSLRDDAPRRQPRLDARPGLRLLRRRAVRPRPTTARRPVCLHVAAPPLHPPRGGPPAVVRQPRGGRGQERRPVRGGDEPAPPAGDAARDRARDLEAARPGLAPRPHRAAGDRAAGRGLGDGVPPRRDRREPSAPRLLQPAAQARARSRSGRGWPAGSPCAARG